MQPKPEPKRSMRFTCGWLSKNTKYVNRWHQSFHLFPSACLNDLMRVIHWRSKLKSNVKDGHHMAYSFVWVLRNTKFCSSCPSHPFQAWFISRGNNLVQNSQLHNSQVLPPYVGLVRLPKGDRLNAKFVPMPENVTFPQHPDANGSWMLLLQT